MANTSLAVNQPTATGTEPAFFAVKLSMGLGGLGGLRITARPEDERALRALLKAFGITVVPDGFGGFVHNAALHVVDRRGRLVAIFDIGEEAQVLAAIRGQP